MDHLKMDQLDPHEDHDTTVVSSSGRDSVSKISLLSSEEAVRKTPDFTVNQQAYTELTPVDGTQHDRQLQDGDIVESDDRPTKTLEDREISSGQRETSDTTHHSNRPESRFVEYENEGLVYEPGLPMPDRLHEPEYVAPSEDSRLQTNDKGYYTESSSLERTSTPDGRHPHVFNKEPTVFVGTLGGPALPSTASNQVMPVDEGTYHMAEMRQRQGHVQKEDSFIIGGEQVFFLIDPFPNKPWFLCVCRTSLLKTLWEKEKLLVTSNFSFSHCVFYLFGELSAIFIKSEIVVCKLFQFGRV